ncbi:MAG: hypothetical protein Q9214_003463 [Letrouitia sp. 1 TL-2023]
MTKISVVQDYQNPQAGETLTLTLDEKIRREVLRNGIHRPKGYTVSYHANPEVEKMHFGSKHPMKPWRLTLTNKIVMAYGMHNAMDVYLSRAATSQEMVEYHKQDYIDFLQSVVPTHRLEQDPVTGAWPYNMGDDCPVFDGLFSYCSLYTGASLDAARKVTNNQSDIAINWSGGLHHAKKAEASGFCYINDIVLAILQLLLYHPRVLYIDLDVHHGDGVEQAFWSTDRVMTLSLHKYDKMNYFPGTGGSDDTGPKTNANPGAHHSLNVPLQDGIDDASYIQLFKDVVGPCIKIYNPTAVVIQCGGDSLGGDRLGCFNLNIRAHGACVEYTKKFNLPLIVLGGGGYTPRNVARLWAYETSVCIGTEVHPSLPAHTPFLEHFAPDRTLFPELSQTGRYDNKNSEKYLRDIVMSVREQLRYVQGSPSVQLQHVPPDIGAVREEVERELQEIKEGKDVGRKRKERGVGTRGEYAH